MTFKIQLLTCVLTIGMLIGAVAQEEESTRCANYYKGTYTLKKGKVKEGYIFINDCKPHLFQQGLRVIDEKAYTRYTKGKKIKKKAIEKFKVKEIKAFALENGRKFRQVKYVNLAATTKVGMLPKRFLLEVAADGDIVVYKKFYRTDNGVIHGEVMDSKLAGGPAHTEFMKNNFQILIQKDKSKNPKNIRSVNIKNYFGDNEEIIQKYLNGDYEFRIQLQREAAFGYNCDVPFLDALVEMANDYNKGVNTELSSTSFDN